VKPYFMDAYRPVKRGDRFVSRRAMKSVEFKIVEVEPGTLSRAWYVVARRFPAR
jgi:hypothetical protein